MKLSKLVFKELMERKVRFFIAALSMVLGIGIIVTLYTTTYYSEKAVQRELDTLGANILILPQNATLADYYSADLEAGEIPEEYVNTLLTSNLEGLDNLSPKLSCPVELNQKQCILTGILPKNEFQSKATWQGAGIFSRPKSCGQVDDIFGLSKKVPKEVLARNRVIDTLESNEVLVGCEIAKQFNLKEATDITLSGRSFKISAILPETGTIDDSRIFAHLHTVQELSGKPSLINAIEVVGCCDQISKGLSGKLGSVLPNAKIITISQIVDTQLKTNQLIRNISNVLLAVILPLSGIVLAKDMYQNVLERKKEIGTLIALGARSSIILKIFLMKASILGVIGGVGGFVLGSLISMVLGPLLAKVPVLPMPSLFFLSLFLSLFVAMLASYFPAKYAARLDPCIVLQET